MSKNSKIGHDPFVYGPRCTSTGWPTQHKSNTGTTPGNKIITINNNNKTTAIYAPPRRTQNIKQNNGFAPPRVGQQNMNINVPV